MTSPLTFSTRKPLPLLADRYASAFYDLASSQNALAAAETDLRNLESILASSAELRTLLATPMIKRDDLAKALAPLLDMAKFNTLTRNFLLVVVGNGRARDIPFILQAFFAHAASARGEVVAQVSSARPLDEATKKALQDALAAALSAHGVKSVSCEVVQDASLIGGVRVQVGSWMYDGTVKGRLQELGQVLRG